MSVDLPDEVFLAVNPRGVLIINPETKDVLSEYPYSEVRDALAWCCPATFLDACFAFVRGAGNVPFLAAVTASCDETTWSCHTHRVQVV